MPDVSGFLVTWATIYRLAEAAHQRSLSDQREAVTCILLSAIAFEAFFNEYLERAAKASSKESESVRVFHSVVGRMDRVPLTAKVEITYYTFTGKQIARGHQPFQGFELLIALRNAIAHQKAEAMILSWLGEAEAEEHKLITALSSRGLIKKPPKGRQDQFLSNISNPQLANWAYNVSVSMTHLLTRILPAGDFEYSIRFLTRQLKKLKSASTLRSTDG